jgi:Cu(I)/Ag(I) efflux system membrane protein CusA/SilA
MWGAGTGSEAMRRIAAPMVGGVLTASLVILIVLPVLFVVVRGWRLPAESSARD